MFILLEGLVVGIISDIVFTPIIAFIESIGILVGVPILIYTEQ